MGNCSSCREKAKRFIVTDAGGACLITEDSSSACRVFQTAGAAMTAASHAGLVGFQVRPT